MIRNFPHIIVSVIYQRRTFDPTTTNHLITSTEDNIKKHPHTGVMLLGDLTIIMTYY